MIRTQLNLEKELHRDLNWLASQRGESMAQVARTLLREGIKKIKIQDYSGGKAIEQLIQMKVKNGEKDLSKKIDYYLYDKDTHDK